jgi:hypothetical protein
MARFFRVSLLAAVALAFVATGASANIPLPELSTVPDMLTISPDGSFEIVIIIQGSQGPVTGSYVEIEFSPEAEGLVAWTVPVPGGADVPGVGPGGGYLFTGNTDANGEIRFKLAGGGCLAQKNNSEPVEPYIAQVRADNILMNEPGVNSPDAVDSNGNLPEDLLYSICSQTTSTTEVGLADALYHTPQIKTGGVEVCSNFTGPDYSDPISIGDAGVLTPYVKAGTSGTCVYNGP